MSLAAQLEARVAAEGPLSIAEFMTACLHDPESGYYATRPALGPEGDFMTAPLVSQMFGELIGLWAVETWLRLGRPEPFRLVELGPGDGALMADALRAARVVPGFHEAARLWLVETSAPLRRLQDLKLGVYEPGWADSLEGVGGEGPLIVIGNEILDCLPARQFVSLGAGAGRRSGWD